jgi:5-methylcytosine-specific restriction protein B
MLARKNVVNAITNLNKSKIMSRIKNLYTYLITNRRAEVDGWLAAYLAFTSDVAKVSAALKEGKKIESKTVYEATSFKAENDPWPVFAKQLLADINNGVSSCGQSILSRENLPRFIGEQDFVNTLTELIKQPDKDNFVKFGEAWERTRQKFNANRNPLLVNRTLAACTRNVTSTVNGAAFESVYWWLVREGFVPQLPSPETDWYDKNVQVMAFLRESFAEELRKGETNEHLLSIFVWCLYENISNPFTLKKQVIKYGAPGTGKTYTAKRDTELLFDIWQEQFGPNINYNHDTNCEVVQFHPSFGYEDFMEGLRPTPDQDGNAQLTLQNGVFKRLCQRAALWEKDVHSIPKHGPDLAKEWESLRIQDLQPHKANLIGEHWRYLFAHAHQDKKVADAVPPFFFIVDEINRAELSRVLGELMICLEYRGVNGAISTQYAALNTKETGLISIGGTYKFFIPHNVYIIGTMNTIDRSVESFDLALRRRFRWERIDPDITALRYHLKQHHDIKPGNVSRPWVGLADDLAALNQHIRATDILGADYEIGHAYLMKLRYQETLTKTEVREKVWEDAIKPLLEEYLRGSGRSETLIPEFQKAFGIT